MRQVIRKIPSSRNKSRKYDLPNKGQQLSQLREFERISVPATTAAILDDEEAWRARSAKRDFFEYASTRFFMSFFSRSRLSMSF